MMHFVSDFINISKYRAMEVQLFAMKIIEGSKFVWYRVLQTVCSVADILYSMSW